MIRTSEARPFWWMWRARKRPMYPSPPTIRTEGFSAMVSPLKIQTGRREGQYEYGGQLSLSGGDGGVVGEGERGAGDRS